MIRYFSLAGLLAACLSPTLDAADAVQEVVIVHFGDSTCITSYLPESQRVEAVLERKLSAFYKQQKIVSHNVAAGGDFIRRFLDSGRYQKVVKNKFPHIDIALIRYGHNDQKHCEPPDFKRHLEEFCDRLGKDYPGIRIVLETNTWVDPEHYSGDPNAIARFNERMNSVWAVVRQVASERKYPLVEIYERKKTETEAGNWDQRIRNQKLSMERFDKRILDGSKDEEMKDVPGWFVDNHPNAKGVEIIADEEFRTMTRRWPKTLPVTAQQEAEALRRSKASFKGWELYVWEQGDQTYFALLMGTNRLKSEQEIAQAAAKGLDAIKLQLSQLKPGQYVFIHGRRLAAPAPVDQAKPLAEYCRKIELKVQ